MLFTERIIVGMGGRGDTYRAAVEMERRWAHSAHFELYEDAVPALAAMRARGLQIGLLSNSSRNLDDFVAHHGLDADAVLTSHAHGKTKPHESIFRALLELLDVAPGEAVMVGDTLHEDIEGALAVGMRAVLIDREGPPSRVRGAAARIYAACRLRSGSNRLAPMRRTNLLLARVRPLLRARRIPVARRARRPGDRRRSRSARRSTSWPTASGRYPFHFHHAIEEWLLVVAGHADAARRGRRAGAARGRRRLLPDRARTAPTRCAGRGRS